MGFIVTDRNNFFSEEKRHANHSVEYLAEGTPAYRLINTCKEGRYRIEKEIIAHSETDAVVQKITFTPLLSELSSYHLYMIVAPHLGNRGGGNNAWIGEHKGVEMLFAEREGYALAVACSVPWLARSAGFVGVSDGWQDLVRNKRMTWTYDRAQNGNVALTGEIDLAAGNGQSTVVVGFGADHIEAGHRALNVILQNFDAERDQYVKEWQGFQDT
jgi:glucoamylase